jgi:hypothetical protein
MATPFLKWMKPGCRLPVWCPFLVSILGAMHGAALSIKLSLALYFQMLHSETHKPLWIVAYIALIRHEAVYL